MPAQADQIENFIQELTARHRSTCILTASPADTLRFCSLDTVCRTSPRAALGRRARTESTHIAAAMNLAGAISVRNSTAAPSRTQLMIRESGATVRPLKVIISGLCDS